LAIVRVKVKTAGGDSYTDSKADCQVSRTLYYNYGLNVSVIIKFKILIITIRRPNKNNP